MRLPWRLELQPKANVTDDVYYKALEIQLGAVVEGRLVIRTRASRKK